MKTYRKEGLDHDFELVIHRGEVQGYVDFKKGDESLFNLRGGKREGINYFKKEEEFLAEDFTEGWEIVYCLNLTATCLTPRLPIPPTSKHG